ncbi:DUF1236 domain-containing protein [Bradyrhizobium sp. CB3481]|uniref:DUF1236 domain-containing protein n=1 Tax=Bradyrhizobium sp. CB3481 TaxID=3039158 RepID=UPI0024B0F597|nr:DUF1236 domain-containing protein [Bradyrhizobium sp. CB3481]WFU13849.1 DUF1236 domain-containing protein [Bradyrhizobium sp. CB3481]
MSNRFLMTVAAAALIAGTGFANAQGTGMGRGDAGSAGSAAQQSAPSSERGGASSGGAMQRDDSSKSGMKGAQSEPKSMGAEKSQRAEEHGKGGKDMKAEGKEGGMKSEKSQTTGQGTGSSTMQKDQGTTQHRDQTTQGRDRDQMQNRDQKAQGQQDRTQSQTQTQGGAAGQSSTTTGQAGAGGKLSTEQRTQITSVIKEQRVQPVTNVNFSVSVGTRVPRDVTFHTLPERVVTIYPEWRRYKFILVKEQIVIVDPNTYEIVAILES